MNPMTSGSPRSTIGADEHAATVRKQGRGVSWSVILGAAFLAGLIAFLGKPYTELPLYVQAAERLRHGEPI
jgi:hypothetical protein